MKGFYALIAILVAVSAAASATAYYFYRQYNSVAQSTALEDGKEAEKLVAQIGALIVLPEDEKPTVATVTDPDRLKGQPFFANAHAGDKVLLYTSALKAVLYNPATNKIINVGPISINNKPSS